MAAPLPTRKSTVDLSKGGLRVSRIRRDPPPAPVKQLTPAEVRARELRNGVVGVMAFALLLFVAWVVINKGPSWTPSKATIVIHDW